MIDNILKKYGVGLALFFLVVFLTYVNSLSLAFMFGSKRQTDLYAGIIGAMAYSMVTVLIMRLSQKKWLKNTFPFYDAALMFFGMILLSPVDVFDWQNKIRLCEIVFLSSFSGLITYSLGQINADIHDLNNSQDLKSENESLKSDISAFEINLKLLESNYNDILESKKTLESNLQETNRMLTVYEESYLLREKARILKKNPENVTENEKEILKKCELIKN